MNNFVYFTTSPYTRESLFGDEEVFEYDDSFHLEHLVVFLGVFTTLTQARKNNWCGEIPRGYNEWKIGKRKFYTYRSLLPTEENRKSIIESINFYQRYGNM